MRRSRSVAGLLVAAGWLVAAPPARGDWIAYLGGGIQETRGPWELRGRQILFHSSNGTLLSVAAAEVDIPASRFLSWHTAPHPAERPPAPISGAPVALEPACVAATVVGVGSAETLQIRAAPAPAAASASTVQRAPAKKTKSPLIQPALPASTAPVETVHLSCLDAPDTRHKFRELSWFGDEAKAAVSRLLRAGLIVCAAEDAGAARDAEGHRFVFIRLSDGSDLVEEVLRAGLALSRSGCSRAERYRLAEAQARAQGRGHWGAHTSEAAIVAVMSHLPRAAGPPPPRAAAGGAPT